MLGWFVDEVTFVNQNQRELSVSQHDGSRPNACGQNDFTVYVFSCGSCCCCRRHYDGGGLVFVSVFRVSVAQVLLELINDSAAQHRLSLPTLKSQ